MVEQVLVELGMQRYADIAARRLSGQPPTRRTPAALQHQPGVIVVDEPTNALDPAGVLFREALLRRAASAAAILVSSHHLDEVARVADRISVINAGRLIGTLDPHGVDIERSFFDLVHSDDDSESPHETVQRRPRRGSPQAPRRPDGAGHDHGSSSTKGGTR